MAESVPKDPESVQDGAAADAPGETGLALTQAFQGAAATRAPSGDVLKPGQALPTVKGYEILSVLGRGGMGIVYKARQVGLKRLVALKMILGGAQADDHQVARFRAEAEAVARLHHAHIVQVYEVAEAAGIPFLSLEFVEGGSLAKRLKGAPQPAQSAAQMTHLLAEAIHYAHQHKVIHRDLKPANILLSDAGADESAENRAGASSALGVPKIADFGLAKQLDDQSDRTQSGSILGTPYYMAPEQAVGHSKDVGPAVDVYALGVILYEMLTGRPPFRGATTLDTLEQVRTQEPVAPSRLQPKVPRDLETICLKCLQKSPRNRYDSAAALAEDLRRFLAHEPILARPVGRIERLARWCRRNPTLASVSGLAGLALAGIFVLAIGFAIQQRQAAIDLAREQKETKRHLHESQRANARTAFDRGRALCEQSQIRHGLLLMAHALTLAPEEDGDLRRVIRANLSAWIRQIHVLRTVNAHERSVMSADFSPDGSVYATLSGSKRVRLWDSVTHRLIHEISVPPEYTWQVAFDPTGRVLVTWSTVEGGITLRLWDIATARAIGEPIRQDLAVKEVRFSPDGKVMVTIGSKGSARITATDTGQIIGAPLRHDRDAIIAIALSPDGKTVLTGGIDGTAILWDAATSRRLGKPLAHGDVVSTLAFSPDGATALTGSNDKTARLWSVATGQVIGAPLLHEHAVVRVAFSPNGRSIATIDGSNLARIWDRQSGKPRGNGGRVEGFALPLQFSPDGKVLVASSVRGTIRLIQTETGNAIGTPLAHQSTGVNDPSIAFTPAGLILTGGFNGGYLWDPATAKPAAEPLPNQGLVTCVAVSRNGAILTGAKDGAATVAGNACVWDPLEGIARGQSLTHGRGVQTAAFSPDGRLLATGGFDNAAQIWDVASGQSRGEPLRHDGPVHAVLFSPDGKTLLTGSEDKAACQWDVATGKRRGPPLVHPAALTPWTIAYSTDGKQILTGSEDGLAFRWDAETGKRCGEPLRHKRMITAVAFSPDGKLALTASQDTHAQLWDAATGNPHGDPFIHHEVSVNAAVFSPDGRTVLTGNSDGTGRLWDIATAKPIGEPLRHQASVRHVAFSCDGARIATASFDETARLWDAGTLQPIGEPLRHLDRVRYVAFSPDGAKVVTASFDKTARVWDAATGKPIGPPLVHDNWVVTASFSPDGESIVTASTDKTARLWHSPPPVPDEPERITHWIQTVTGMELDTNGALRTLDGPAWHKTKERLDQLGGPPRRRIREGPLAFRGGGWLL